MEPCVKTLRLERGDSFEGGTRTLELSLTPGETTEVSRPEQVHQSQALPLHHCAAGHSTSWKGWFTTVAGQAGEKEDHTASESATFAPTATSAAELVAYRNDAAVSFSRAAAPGAAAAALLSPAGACSTLSSASTSAASSPLVFKPSSLLLDGSHSPAHHLTQRKKPAVALPRKPLAPAVMQSDSCPTTTQGDAAALPSGRLREGLKCVEPFQYQSTPVCSACRITATGVHLLDSPTAAADAAANLAAGGGLRATSTATAAAAAWPAATSLLDGIAAATACPTACTGPVAPPLTIKTPATVEPCPAEEGTSIQVVRHGLSQHNAGEERGHQEQSCGASRSFFFPLEAAGSWVKRVALPPKLVCTGLSSAQQKALSPSSPVTAVNTAASPGKTAAAAAGVGAAAAPAFFSGSCMTAASITGSAAASSHFTVASGSRHMHSPPICPSSGPPHSWLHLAAGSNAPLLKTPALIPYPAGTHCTQQLEAECGRNQSPLGSGNSLRMQQAPEKARQSAERLARVEPLRIQHNDEDVVVSLPLWLGAAGGNSNPSPYDAKRPGSSPCDVQQLDSQAKQTIRTRECWCPEAAASLPSNVTENGALQMAPRLPAGGAGGASANEAEARPTSDTTMATAACTVAQDTCALFTKGVAATNWHAHYRQPPSKCPIAATTAAPTEPAANSSIIPAATEGGPYSIVSDLTWQTATTLDVEQPQSQRKHCEEDKYSGINSIETRNDNSNGNSVTFQMVPRLDESGYRSRQTSGSDGNTDGTSPSKSKTTNCNDGTDTKVHWRCAHPELPVTVNGQSSRYLSSLNAAAAQRNSRHSPAIMTGEIKYFDGSIPPAASSVARVSAPLLPPNGSIAGKEKTLAGCLRRPGFEQQSAQWLKSQQGQASQQSYLVRQNLQLQQNNQRQLVHNQQQQPLLQQREHSLQQSLGQPYQHLQNQLLECPFPWQHEYHSIHRFQYQPSPSKPQSYAQILPKSERRQTQQHNMQHLQALHSLSSLEDPPAKFFQMYHHPHYNSQCPTERLYDDPQLRPWHQLQHTPQQHLQDLSTQQHIQSHQRLFQRQPPYPPQPPGLLERHFSLSVQQPFLNNVKPQQQPFVHQVLQQQHIQQHQQYQIPQQNLWPQFRQEPLLQNGRHQQQQQQCGGRLRPGIPSRLLCRQQVSRMLSSSPDVTQQREEHAACIYAEAPPWINSTVNWWQIRKVLSQTECRPLRLSRFGMVEAYAKCVACTIVTVVPSPAAGVLLLQPCRFCFECHAGTSVNECIRHDQTGSVNSSGSTWTACEFLAHTADRPDTAHGRSVYVANMMPGTSKEALKSAIDLLLDHGCVVAVEMKERNNLQPYAFVELSTLQAAYELVQHKKTALVIQDQQLKVQFKKIGLTCSLSSSSSITSSSTASSPPLAVPSALSCCACCCQRKNANRSTPAAASVDSRVLGASGQEKALEASAGGLVQRQDRCELSVCVEDACVSKPSPVGTGEAPDEQNGKQVRCCHSIQNNTAAGCAKAEGPSTPGRSPIRDSSFCQADCTSCTAIGRNHECYARYHPTTAVEKKNSCCGCTCSPASASSAAGNILLQLQPFIATGETVLEVCRTVSYKLAQDYGLPSPLVPNPACIGTQYTDKLPYNALPTKDRQCYSCHAADSSCRSLTQQLPAPCAAPGSASSSRTGESPDSSSTTTLKSNPETFNCHSFVSRDGCRAPEQIQEHAEHVEGQQTSHKHVKAQRRGGEYVQEPQVQFPQLKQRQAMHADEPPHQKQVIEHEEITLAISSSLGTLRENRSTGDNVGASSVASISTGNIRSNAGNLLYSADPEATAAPAAFRAAEAKKDSEKEIFIDRSTAVAVRAREAAKPLVALLDSERTGTTKVLATNTIKATLTRSLSVDAAEAASSAAAAAALPAAARASSAAAAAPRKQADEEHFVQKREIPEVHGQLEMYAERNSVSGVEVYVSSSQPFDDGSLQKLLSACNVTVNNVGDREIERDKSDQLGQLMSAHADQTQPALHSVQQEKQHVCLHRSSHLWQRPPRPDLQQQHLQSSRAPSTRDVLQDIHYRGSTNSSDHTGLIDDVRAGRPVSPDAPIPPPREQGQNAGAWPLSQNATRTALSIDCNPIVPPFSTATSPDPLSTRSSCCLQALPLQQQHVVMHAVRLNRQQRRQLSPDLELTTAPEQTQQRQQHEGQPEQQEGYARQQRKRNLEYEQQEQRGGKGYVGNPLPAHQADMQPQQVAKMEAELMMQGRDTLSYCSSEEDRVEPHDFADNVESSSRETTIGNNMWLNHGQQNASTLVSLDSYTTASSASEKCRKGAVALPHAEARMVAVLPTSTSQEGGQAAPVEVQQAAQESPFFSRKATMHTFITPPSATQLHTEIFGLTPATTGAEPLCKSLPQALLDAPEVSRSPATAATICSKTETAATAGAVSSTPDASNVAALAPVLLAASVVQCFLTPKAPEVGEPAGWKAASPPLSSGLSGASVPAVKRNTTKTCAKHARGVYNIGYRSFRANSSVVRDRSNRRKLTRTTARNRAASSIVFFTCEDHRDGTEDGSVSVSSKTHPGFDSTKKTCSGAHASSRAALISAFATIIAAAGKVAKTNTFPETGCSPENVRQKVKGMPELQRQLIQQLKRLHELHSQKQEIKPLEKHEYDRLQSKQQYQLVQQPAEPHNLQQQRSPQCVQRCHSAELEENNQRGRELQKTLIYKEVQKECGREQQAHLQDTSTTAVDPKHQTGGNLYTSPDTTNPKILSPAAVLSLRDRHPQQGEETHSTVQVHQARPLQQGKHSTQVQIDTSDGVAVAAASQDWKDLQAAQQAQQRFGQQQQPHLTQHLEQQRQHQRERELLLLKCLHKRRRAQQQLLKEQHLQQEQEMQQGSTAPDPDLSSSKESGQLRTMTEHQQFINENGALETAVIRQAGRCFPKEGSSCWIKHIDAANSPAAQPPMHCAQHKNGEAELVCIRQQALQQQPKHPDPEQTPRQPPIFQLTLQQLLHSPNVQECHSQNVLIGNNSSRGASADGTGVPEYQDGWKGTDSPIGGWRFIPENKNFSAEGQGVQHLARHQGNFSPFGNVGEAGDQHVFDNNTAVFSTNENSNDITEGHIAPQERSLLELAIDVEPAAACAVRSQRLSERGLREYWTCLRARKWLSSLGVAVDVVIHAGAAGARRTPIAADKDSNEARGSIRKTAGSMARSGTVLEEAGRLRGSVKRITDSTEEALNEQYSGYALPTIETGCSKQELPFFGGILDKLGTPEPTANVRSLNAAAEIAQAGCSAVAPTAEKVSVALEGVGYSRAARPTEEDGSNPWTKRGIVDADKTLTMETGVKRQPIAHAAPTAVGYDEVRKDGGASVVSADAPPHCGSLVRHVSTSLQQFSCSSPELPESNGVSELCTTAAFCSAAATEEKVTEKSCSLPLAKTSLQRCSPGHHNEVVHHLLTDTTTSSSLAPADDVEAALIAEVAALLSSGEDDDERFERRLRGGTHSATPSAVQRKTSSCSSWMCHGSAATLSQVRSSTSEGLLFPQVLWGTSASGNRVARLENCSSPYNICPSSRHATATHTLEIPCSSSAVNRSPVEPAETLRSRSPQVATRVDTSPSADRARASQGSRTAEPSIEVIYMANEPHPSSVSAKSGEPVNPSTYWTKGILSGVPSDGTIAPVIFSTQNPFSDSAQEAGQRLSCPEQQPIPWSQGVRLDKPEGIKHSAHEQIYSLERSKRNHLHQLQQRETPEQEAPQQEPQSQQQRVTSSLAVTGATLAEICSGENPDLSDVSATNGGQTNAAKHTEGCTTSSETRKTVCTTTCRQSEVSKLCEMPQVNFLVCAFSRFCMEDTNKDCTHRVAAGGMVAGEQEMALDARHGDNAEHSDIGGNKKNKVDIGADRKTAGKAHSKAGKRRREVKDRNTRKESENSKCRGRSSAGSLKSRVAPTLGESGASSGCSERSRRVGRQPRRGKRAGRTSEKSAFAVRVESSTRVIDAAEASAEIMSGLPAPTDVEPETEPAAGEIHTNAEAEEAATADKRRRASS